MFQRILILMGHYEMNLQSFVDLFFFFFSNRCQVTHSGTIKSLGGGGGGESADSLITRTHADTHIAPTWEPHSTDFILGNDGVI